MKFLDETNLKVIAGKGGNGMIAFRREAHVDRGGPDGGDGGKGGSIFFVPDYGTNTLLNLYLTKTVKGEDGENGRRKNQYGAAGADKYIKVPFGTLVKTIDGKIVADIIEDKPYLIALGGKGGRGNTKFKSARHTAPSIAENGDLGQEFDLILNLKIMADVGLVGKPSAGKSTIISKLSNAKAKIADYEFTTLVPQLGLVKYKDKSFVIADLPGLIKGASLGKGLGFQFLKHIERCRLILHILDFGSENKNPIEDYEQINLELDEYSDLLKNKKRIIVANKSDLQAYKEHIEKFKKQFPDIKIVEVSSLTEQNLEVLKSIVVDELELINSPILEKTESEITITLDLWYDVVKVHEGFYEIIGPEVEKIYHKIPLISHDNLMLFNKKLKDLGVWSLLEKKGVQPGDTVRILGYEFTWEEEY